MLDERAVRSKMYVLATGCCLLAELLDHLCPKDFAHHPIIAIFVANSRKFQLQKHVGHIRLMQHCVDFFFGVFLSQAPPDVLLTPLKKHYART